MAGPWREAIRQSSLRLPAPAMPTNLSRRAVVPKDPELNVALPDPKVEFVDQPTVAAAHFVAATDRLDPLAGLRFVVSHGFAFLPHSTHSDRASYRAIFTSGFNSSYLSGSFARRTHSRRPRRSSDNPITSLVSVILELDSVPFAGINERLLCRQRR